MDGWTTAQRRTISNFFTNSAVAWFTLGIATPAIIRPENLTDLATNLGWGMLMTYLFMKLALEYS
jgi:hypothetical protein